MGARLPALDARVDLVVVAGIRRVDLGDRLQPARLVERSRGDRDRVAVRGVPEQARATLAAESAARVGVALGTVYPAQSALGDQAKCPGGDGSGGAHVPVPAAALGAVAEDHVAQGLVDLVADGTA